MVFQITFGVDSRKFTNRFFTEAVGNLKWRVSSLGKAAHLKMKIKQINWTIFKSTVFFRKSWRHIDLQLFLFLPLKSTSPFPSESKISMTLWTSGFCCSSGSDMNSSTERAPELSRSSFRNRFPSLLISSASTAKNKKMKYKELDCKNDKQTR